MIDSTKCYKGLISLVLSFVFLLSFSVQALAIPASPKLIKALQKDGSTLSIRLYGDEYFKWKTTEDGYPVVEQDGYFYYANYNSKGEIEMSTERVSINGLIKKPSSAITKANMGVIASSASSASRISAAPNSRTELLGTGFPSEGNVKSVVILVEYYDVKFTVDDPQQAFYNQLNQENYSVAGATGSARDYFLANSDGKFDGQFDVFGPYELSQPQRYYGGNSTTTGADLRPQDMIEEAVKLAYNDGVDFSQYDFNNDGYIDNIFVYYAGRSEAEGGSSDCVWPHKWNVFSQPEYNGKILDVYACSSELRGADTDEATIAGIGTFCHEFSHVFGLADHYDTTGTTDGTSYGLGAYDIMTLGSYNNDGNTPPLHNALERMMIGWVEPVELEGDQAITLGPINDGVVYRMSTDTEGEFFLFENRYRNDNIWDYYTPGEGLFITHVDQSEPYIEDWNNNYPNGNVSHECFRFIVAGNVSLDYYSGWDKVPYPYTDIWYTANNNNEWSPNTRPKAESWSGAIMPYQITNIAKDGRNITFNVSEATINSISGSVKDAYGAYLADATITLTNNETGVVYSGVSNSSGLMVFDDDFIPNGNYTMVVSADSYAPFTKTFDLLQGAEVYATLYSEAQGSMRQIAHHNGEFSHAVGSYYQIRPMAIMTAEMLKEHIGCAIKEVRFYAAAPFEGQLIIQPALYGSGWSPGETFEVTEADLGWHTLDFTGLDTSTGGDVIIAPETDYYVKIMIITDTEANPALGMDTSTDESLYAYSSLLDESGYDPLRIYDCGGLEGNLLITLALSEESIYVAPTSFTKNPAYDDGVTINVNEVSRIYWSTTPANGNPACHWSSSDESVVTVDGNGNLLGISEGVATVSAVSVLDPAVTMSYEVTVTISEARAKGRAIQFNTEIGVGGLSLDFYQIAATTGTINYYAPQALTEQKAALRSGDVEQLSAPNTDKFSVSTLEGLEPDSVVTDSDGYYSASGLIAGSKYKIVIEQDSFDDPWRTATQTLYTALTPYDAADPEGTINDLGNIELFSNSIYGAERVSYYDGDLELTAIGDNTTPVMYAIRIPAERLIDKIGYQVTHLGAVVDNLLDPYIEAIVFSLDHNGELVYQGGTSHGELDTEVTNGQHIFELVNEDPAIIRPETDYYVTIKMMGQMGAQSNSSNSNNGYSNLLWDSNSGSFASITELGMSEKIDWQIAMFTKYREIDPITSIAVVPTSYDIMPCVGIDYALTASLTPSTATYTNVTWSSSDESIATIDEYGTASLLQDGSVTFTATSVTYPDVKGELKVNVTLMQGVSGYVVNSDGNAVGGAEITFYPAVYATTKQGALNTASYTRSSESGYTVSSEDDGTFYIDLQSGVYEMEAKSNGLMDYQGLITVEYGLNTTQVLMYQYIENLSDFMCYTTPSIDSSIGDESYNFVPYTRWDAEDLTEHVGNQITRFKALVIGAANVRFVVFTPAADEYIYRSPLIAVEESTLAMVVHDVPADSYIDIVAGQDYCIGYEVADYDEDVAPAVLSKSVATIPGKSDCIVYRNELTSLTDLSNGISIGNWVIGFYIQDAEQQKGINISVGQKDALLTWNPGAYSSFLLSYGAEGGVQTTTTVDDCQAEISGLTMGTTYNIKISGVETVGSNIELISTSFTTLAQKTTIPLVQLNAYKGYQAGEILTLKSLNTESTDTVEWYVNSEKLPRNTIILEAGEHKIQCRVTRGSRTFVTTRHINVE